MEGSEILLLCPWDYYPCSEALCLGTLFGDVYQFEACKMYIYWLTYMIMLETRFSSDHTLSV